MKSIDINRIDDLPGELIKEGETFRFACHPGVSCFNRCCRNLNLYLYPYDIVRLKNRLGLSSGEFLDRYVNVVLRPSEFFPEALLQMEENEEKTCPFLTKEGCLVYPDRPQSCRMFPVETGVLYDEKNDKNQWVYFFRPPEFCRGQEETNTWTTEEWIKDQNAETYNKMTARWSEIRRHFYEDLWDGEGPSGKKAKMVFMAVYNIDAFREFVFNSTFLKRFKIKPEKKARLKKDDIALLELGFNWVEFFLFGRKFQR